MMSVGIVYTHLLDLYILFGTQDFHLVHSDLTQIRVFLVFNALTQQSLAIVMSLASGLKIWILEELMIPMSKDVGYPFISKILSQSDHANIK